MIIEKLEKVFKELRNNSRSTYIEISDRTDIPKSTVARIVKVSRPYIIKHTPLCDFTKMEYTIKAIFIAKTSNTLCWKLHAFLESSSCINCVYLAKKNVFYFEALFKNMDGFEKFKADLYKNGSIDCKVHFILEELKREGFMT